MTDPNASAWSTHFSTDSCPLSSLCVAHVQTAGPTEITRVIAPCFPHNSNAALKLNNILPPK